MKKTLLGFLFLISSLISFSQSYYKATVTEMYTYNSNTKEWDLYQKNSDVNIIVVIEDEYITFQAKKPSMYRIYLSTKEPLSTKSLSGFRYGAKDLKEEKYVKMDVLVSNDSPIALVSIINVNEGYNLRFFLTKVFE